MILTGRGLVFGQFLEKKCPVDPSMQISGLLYFCHTDILEGKGRIKKHPDYTPSALLETLPKEPLTTQKKDSIFLIKEQC